MSFGVTPTGFVKKTFTVVKGEIETDWRTAFGPTVDIAPEGPIGQIIGIHAKRESDLWDLAEEIYTIFNPSEVTNASQDNLYSMVGLRRIASSPSYFNDVLIWGDSGTSISATREAAQSATNKIFSLEEDVTLSDSLCRAVRLEFIRGTGAETFTAVIAGYTTTYTCAIGATLQQVVDGWIAALDATAFTGTWVDLGSGVVEVRGGLTDFTLSGLTATVEIVLVANAGKFVCKEDGGTPVPLGTLDTIYTPVVGWIEIYAPYEGTAGRDTETDYEFRVRQSLFYAVGKGTEDAIRLNILNEVDGIISCTVNSNRTNSTDSEGLPAKSFRVIVEGGADADIGQIIWETQPAGIESYGSTSVNVIDSEGRTQVVKFDRPIVAYIYVKVKRDLYADGIETYPVDGDQRIIDAVYNWAINEYTAGKDVYPQRMSVPVYSVPGIGEIEIEVAQVASLPGSPVYGTTKLEMGSTTLAVFSTDRITVEDLTP